MLDNFSELLERNGNTDYAAVAAQSSINTAYDADIDGVFRGEVVRVGAHGLAWTTLGGLIPRALARIVTGTLRIIRPGNEASGTVAENNIGVRRVATGQVRIESKDLLIQRALRDISGVRVGIVFKAAVSVFQ
ncbi:hypothetical protein D3C78_1567570 [compost metagenome]